MIERRVQIERDEDPCSPREDCNVGRMLCWHNRYKLGDDHSYDSADWKRELACEADSSLEEYVDRLENEVSDKLYVRATENGCEGYDEYVAYVERFIRKRINDRVDKAFDAGYVALPLFLYDHSGITMSAGAFDCLWDSGYVGVIICDQETIENDFGGCRDKARAALRSEIEVYDDYLTGNVWGYVCEERDDSGCNACNRKYDWEHVDSCWGFYGDPDCMKSEIPDDFADAFESALASL